MLSLTPWQGRTNTQNPPRNSSATACPLVAAHSTSVLGSADSLQCKPLSRVFMRLYFLGFLSHMNPHPLQSLQLCLHQQTKPIMKINSKGIWWYCIGACP